MLSLFQSLTYDVQTNIVLGLFAVGTLFLIAGLICCVIMLFKEGDEEHEKQEI